MPAFFDGSICFILWTGKIASKLSTGDCKRQVCNVAGESNRISGTRFDCPGFVAMLEQSENGNVEAVCIKDMSRLGRAVHKPCGKWA